MLLLELGSLGSLRSRQEEQFGIVWGKQWLCLSGLKKASCVGTRDMHGVCVSKCVLTVEWWCRGVQQCE